MLLKIGGRRGEPDPLLVGIDTVNADRAILVRPSVSLWQPVKVDVVSQRVERSVRASPGQMVTQSLGTIDSDQQRA